MDRFGLGNTTRVILKFAYLMTRARSRGIATSSRLVQKAMEKLEKNPYYEKYAERIAQLQRTSPEEFMQRVERVCAAPRSSAADEPDTRQYSSVLNPKRPLKENISIEDRKLDDIFKIDLVKNKNASEIQDIWEEYHRNKEVISATIPLEVYSAIQLRMHECPTFLFPLPREHGYEFVMCQSYSHTVHFTPLLAFQVHKENAPECLTMVHFMELKEKGIVLMRGEYDKNVLNGQEAQCLANQFQLYYSGKDPVKLQLLQNFTTSPDSFRHMDLISQMEKIVLS